MENDLKTSLDLMSGNHRPKVLISVVNWNGREMLHTCLSTLLESTEYPNFDVLVVDNGSEDGSVSMVKSEFEDVYLISNDQNRGFSGGQNQGIEFAEQNGYDFVLLFNNDAQIKNSSWLDSIISVMESDESIGVCGCTVTEPDGSVHYNGRYFPISEFVFSRLKERYRYNRFERETSEERPFEYIDDVTGAAYCIRIDTVKRVGCLDEAYNPVYYEESDYSVRVWDADFKIAYTNEGEIVHSRHGTTESLDATWKQSVTHRNRLRFVLTNYPLEWILVGLPFLLLQTLQIAVASTDSGYILRSEAKKKPLNTLRLMLRPYVAILLDSITILSARRSREDVKTLIK